MTIKLNANKEAKLNYHNGIYTRSYQEARAVFDAKIRNWEIDYVDSLFNIKDSKDIIEKVYLDSKIQNCSCIDFVENQCNTCMHIEAIKLIPFAEKPQINIVRPIAFINVNSELKQIGQGNLSLTPAVKPFIAAKNKKLPIIDKIYSDDEINILKEYGINLYDFQILSIKAMLNNIKTILCLKMGLGKTLCALTCCKILSDKQKILIVAPNSLKYQWQAEINRLKLGTSLVIAKGPEIKSYESHRFLIISYEMLNRHKEILEKTFDIIIADEIQKIKNAESVSWATLASSKSEYVFALSGTPIQNNISDLLSLINFLNPSELRPKWKFYEEYCNFTRAKLFGIRQEKIGLLKNKLSRYIINPPIDYSKFKLPEKKESWIHTKLDETQQQLHDEYISCAKPIIAKSMNYPLTFAEKACLNGLLTLASMSAVDARLIKPDCSASERFNKVCDHIVDIIKKNEKIVLYSCWIKVLELFDAFLKEKQIGHVMFHGTGMSAKIKNKNLISFINEEDIKVFLSTDSGGLGIDGLQLGSNNVIHIEQIWNPSKIDQRNGRLVRYLQKKDIVNIYRCTSDSEIEKMITAASERKYKTISSIMT